MFQCYVGFCHITMQMSHNYICIPSLPNLLPLSHPISLGHQRVPDWAGCATQQLSTSYPSYTLIVYICCTIFSIRSTLSLPYVSTSPFSISVSPLLLHK